jgi:hypothetical protein
LTAIHDPATQQLNIELKIGEHIGVRPLIKSKEFKAGSLIRFSASELSEICSTISFASSDIKNQH